MVLTILVVLPVSFLRFAVADDKTPDPIIPLDVEATLSMLEFPAYMPIGLSPDGKFVTYSTRDPLRRVAPKEVRFKETGVHMFVAGLDIWVADTQTGESKNITAGRGSNWAPAWSPDGKFLAFYSDRGGVASLWVWQRSTDTMHQISDLEIRSTFGWELQWTPDGKQVLVSLKSESIKPGPAFEKKEILPENDQESGKDGALTVRVFRSITSEEENSDENNLGTNFFDISDRKIDLALVDVASGEVNRIAKDVVPIWTRISPDGTHVAFTNALGIRVPGTFTALLDLELVSIADGKQRTLAKAVPMGNGGGRASMDVSWSPDSKTLVYPSVDGKTPDNTFVVSLNGDIRAVTETPHPQFQGKAVWDKEGDNIYFVEGNSLWRVSASDGSAKKITQIPGKTIKVVVSYSINRDRAWSQDNGKSIVLVAGDELKNGFYRVNLNSGNSEILFEEEKRYGVSNIIASNKGKFIVFPAQDARRPEDLWITQGTMEASRQLTMLNPKISSATLGQRRIVEWTGREGKPQKGLLLLPGGYEPGQRYPLVAYVYPAGILNSANNFGFRSGFLNLQLLASRGFAVLYPDMPGVLVSEPMKGIADIALPGIDKIVDMGIADPKRVGVMGHSFGGYATLSLIVQSTRFKAAVDSAGPSNLISGYGMMDNTGYSHPVATQEANMKLTIHPWEARDLYIRNSPWFFLDKVETPLLILQGTDDRAVSVEQANAVFVGLRRLGKDVVYVQYEGEGHVIQSWANQVDFVNRYIDWFEKYLGEPEANLEKLEENKEITLF